MFLNIGASNQKGFTLVELMIVIAIIGVLAAIAVPRYINEVYHANGAKLKTDLQTINASIAVVQANGWQIASVADISDPVQCPPQILAVLANPPLPPKGMYITSLTPTPTSVPAVVYEIDAQGRAVCGNKLAEEI